MKCVMYILFFVPLGATRAMQPTADFNQACITISALVKNFAKHSQPNPSSKAIKNESSLRENDHQQTLQDRLNLLFSTKHM